MQGPSTIRLLGPRGGSTFVRHLSGPGEKGVVTLAIPARPKPRKRIPDPEKLR
jgi:hypothetical protein